MNEFINSIAVTGNSTIPDDNCECYYSKIDRSYITRKGMEDSGFRFLLKRGITEQVQNQSNIKGNSANIGFNPEEQKWYGWSHRAIFGFGIGSTCKKGNCHYTANNPEEMIEDYGNFFAEFGEEIAQEYKDQCLILSDRSGILINHSGWEMPMANNVNELVKAINSEIDLPEKNVLSGMEIKNCGKGEWTAKSLDDAKQMAKDFAEDVS